MILFILLAIVIIILTSLIIYARWNYGTLEALGIPVVKPYFILGSTPDLHLKIAHFEDIQRFKTYGPVYGVYEGRTPQIHICDPELVRQIYVKDFEYFHDRRGLELGNPLLNEMIDFIPGEKWKVVRNMLTPTLSASRVKSMVGMTREAVLEFNKRMKTNIKEKGNDGVLKVEVRSLAAGLLIDYLARCSFGIKVGNPEDPNNYFIQTFKEITGNDKDFDLLYNLSLTFPFLTKLAPTLDTKGSDKFVNTFRLVMKERKLTNAPKINDLADKLNEMLDLLDTPEYKRVGITENTIFAQAVGGFFLAAYDSIITVLVMLPHFLATNPRVEEKVHRELQDFFESSDGKHGLEAEHLPQLEYLGACITEVLRLVPPFIRPERVCTKDWSYKGLKIKKGQVIMLPAWAYHRNPELFANPEDFYPERFLGENKKDLHQYGFATFGFGPRSCAGIRFANDTMKMCLAYIFKEFQFRLRPETKVEYKPGVLFLLMYGPLYMDMVQRK